MRPRHVNGSPVHAYVLMELGRAYFEDAANVKALVVIGAASWFRLGVDRFPAVDLPTVTVRVEDFAGRFPWIPAIATCFSPGRSAASIAAATQLELAR